MAEFTFKVFEFLFCLTCLIGVIVAFGMFLYCIYRPIRESIKDLKKEKENGL